MQHAQGRDVVLRFNDELCALGVESLNLTVRIKIQLQE
jgi:hypothetical protein